MARSAGAALTDAGIINVDLVDGLACVEPLALSYADVGAAVLAHLPIAHSVEHLWVPAGGTSPQDLLHQVGMRIAAGELHCVVICGAELMRSRTLARRDGRSLDWPDKPADVNPMRGQRPFCSDLEQQHGLRMPIQLFPLIENALGHARGRDASAQARYAAGLLARNARVAATNPDAWFQDTPSMEEIAEVSRDNRMIVYPYTKRMNAIMQVDQSAAVVVVSDKFAREHGLAKSSIAVLGGAGAEEIWNPIERESWAECPAMDFAINKALERAGSLTDDLTGMDLYSCFPSAIQLGMAALNLAEDDERPLSLTGGLAFAGGPGNAYVLHSLARATELIRAHPDERVLVTGIGMANTKHAATVLGHAMSIPDTAFGDVAYRDECSLEARVVLPRASGRGTVHTYTVEYDRVGEPTNIILILDLDKRERTIANVRRVSEVIDRVLASDPIGRTGVVEYDPQQNRNFFTFNEN